MPASLQVVKDNTIAEHKGMGCENVDWNHWAQKRAKMGSAVNAVIVIREWCSELSCGMYCRVKSGMMEAVRTSETSDYNYFTRHYIPEDNSELHTRHCENLKSQMIREVQNCLLGCTARTSETSVDNYFTRQYIPEDNSELHTRHRENLKSHIIIRVQ
jgi:hypothetical protein